MESENNILRKLKLGNLAYSTHLLLLASVLIVFVILIIVSKNWSGSQVIRELEISGTKHLVPNEISKLIRDSVVGKPTKEVNFNKVRDIIRRNDFVLDAVITSKLNGDLKVEITEREPKAYFVDAQGNIEYIDSLGFIINYRAITEYANLPVITGISDQQKDSLAIRNAMYILRKIRSYNAFNLLDYISEIQYNDWDKTFNVITNDFALFIKIGRVSFIEEKLVKLHEVLISNFAKDNFNKIKYIDLRWRDQVLVSLN